MLARIYFHLGSIFICPLALPLAPFLSPSFSLENYAKRVCFGSAHTRALSLSFSLSLPGLFLSYFFFLFSLDCKIIITCGFSAA